MWVGSTARGTKIVRVDRGRTLSEVARVALRSGHTRLPVVKGDEVVGMVHTKELLALRASGAEDWGPLVRAIVRLDEATTLLGALRVMQAQRSHLCLVLRRGRPLGIVTVEDILEEVVGEIYDEDDDGRLSRLLGSGAARRGVQGRREPARCGLRLSASPKPYYVTTPCAPESAKARSSRPRCSPPRSRPVPRRPRSPPIR